jgi:hypothetical protein
VEQLEGSTIRRFSKTLLSLEVARLTRMEHGGELN